MGYLTCCIKRSKDLNTDRPATTKLRVFTYEELSSATSDFSASAFLGRGSHGSVYLATLDSGRLVAAAKLPSPSDDDQQPQQPSAMDAEISLLSTLPHSPLIVNLVGASHAAGPSRRIAVVDLMPQGSLHELLHLPLGGPPPFRRRLQLAARAAAALAHLHALGVVHRDVKPSNLLLDSKGRPRLADFSLAVRLAPVGGDDGCGALHPPPAGTMGYIDPRYIRPEDVTAMTDVYSFGVVLLEILSGRRGIDVEYSPPSLVDWAEPLVAEGRFAELYDPRGLPKPGREEAMARETAEIAGRCVADRAEERPTMAEVAARLQAAERRVVDRWRWIPRWDLDGHWKRTSSSRNGKVSDMRT